MEIVSTLSLNFNGIPGLSYSAGVFTFANDITVIISYTLRSTVSGVGANIGSWIETGGSGDRPFYAEFGIEEVGYGGGSCILHFNPGESFRLYFFSATAVNLSTAFNFNSFISIHSLN